MRLFSVSKEYKPEGRVLEVACGYAPTAEANVLTDADPKAIEANKKAGRVAVTASGLDLPFKDKEFDYVTCLHFAEHLEHGELAKLFSEMERVGRRGYLEVPSIYWELLHNGDLGMYPNESPYDIHHKQYCFRYNNELHFIRKSDEFDFTHKILGTLFHQVLNEYVTKHVIDLMMIGHAWEGKIKYRVHKSLNDIPSELKEAMLKQLEAYAKSHPKISNRKLLLKELLASVRHRLRI